VKSKRRAHTKACANAIGVELFFPVLLVVVVRIVRILIMLPQRNSNENVEVLLVAASWMR
jgi:uncharacterized membrane protein